jgi:hypothetical protein
LNGRKAAQAAHDSISSRAAAADEPI